MAHPMTTSERMALGEYLTEWDDDMTYQEVIDTLKMHKDISTKGHELTVWEGAENLTPSDLVEQIERLRSMLDDRVKLSY